jgi:hypothetical protein
MKTFKVAAIVPLCAGLLFACETSAGSGAKSPDDSGTIIKTVNNSSAPYTASAAIRKLFASGEAASETVSLSGLANHSVYLVKVNKGGSTVSAANTGSVTPYSASWGAGEADALANEERLSAADAADADPLAPSSAAPSSLEVSGIFTDGDGRTVTRCEPPARLRAVPDGLPKPAGRADGLLLNGTRLAVQYAVGSRKQFWVQDDSGNFTRIYATLCATGTHGNVWVAEDNINPKHNNYSEFSSSSSDNKINQAQAEAIADKFDLIYGKETALFGFEYGGGTRLGACLRSNCATCGGLPRSRSIPTPTGCGGRYRTRRARCSSARLRRGR